MSTNKNQQQSQSQRQQRGGSTKKQSASPPSEPALQSPPKAEELPDLRDLQELQPTINVGLIGHVAHGKSTIVRQISGIKTGTHSSELERNMTIKLGYANAKIYKCDLCPRPRCYQAFGSTIKDPKCAHCESPLPLVRHISFVDCPGHEVLMATMLNAAAAMDGAVLVVAANEECPQPQTAEHLAAASLTGIPHMFAVQNKVDLVDPAAARAHYAAIQQFTKGTPAEKVPAIPVAAQFGINVDVLLEYLVEKLPQPKRDLEAPACLQAIRSFDINKPGTPFEQIKGAVLGGTLSRGVLRIGQTVEVRPGIVTKDADGIMTSTPLFTKVTSISSEKNSLKAAVPGGLIGVGTHIDSSLGQNDGLVGQVLGPVGSLPPVYQDLQIRYRLMLRLLGSDNGAEVAPIKKGDTLLMHVGSNTTRGVVMSVPRSTSSSSASSAGSGSVSKAKGKQAAAAPSRATGKKAAAPPSKTVAKKDADEDDDDTSTSGSDSHKGIFNIRLTQMPVCANPGDKVAFSRELVPGQGHFRLIGFGNITSRSRPINLLSTYSPKA